MGLCISTTSRRPSQSTARIGQSAICGGFQRQTRRAASIHFLDDDSLLHVFYLYRPISEDGDDIADWTYVGRWWYALSHVCRRWRNIIHGSTTYLSLSLLCTYGTPVADMLAGSPPLPLAVGYFTKGRELTAEDEEGIILALKQRNRVRRVRLHNAATIVQKVIVVMEEEYPILEFLYINLLTEDNSSILTFTETLQAPHLRYLDLRGFALPIGSPILTTAVGLVSLYLNMVRPSTYFHPNTLIQWMSLMPHLVTLIIHFEFSTPSRDVERQARQLTHTLITAPVMLPNLLFFGFRGISTYLEALVHRITAPRLVMLEIEFFNQLTFSVPRLLRFIIAAENLTFGNAVLSFSKKSVDVEFSSHEETKMSHFAITVGCWDLDWQVSSMAQVSNSLNQIFSAVERLVLQHSIHSESSEEHNDVDRTEWRKLLRPFRNVKTLRIEGGLVEDLSRSLESEDGELPLELFPELLELEYFGIGDARDAFTSFVDARRNTGRPVTLAHL